MQRMKEETLQTESIRNNERLKHEQHIKQLQDCFDNKRLHIENTLKLDPTEQKEHDHLTVTQNISGTFNGLNNLLVSTLDELEELMRTREALFHNKLEEERIARNKLEATLFHCQQETCNMRPNLKLLYETISSDQCSLHHLERTVNSQKRRIRVLEQKYFYSLVLGVKLNELNISLFGHNGELWRHGGFEPGDLFSEVKEEGVEIERWAVWVANKWKHSLRNVNENLDS